MSTMSNESRVVVLARTRTRTERRLVAEWAQAHHPGADVVEGVAEATWPDTTTLVPVRKARRTADVVAGEPATVADLRARFAAETGGQSSFGSFVARAATVACDRAERRLIGDRYKVPRQVVEQITASKPFQDRVVALAKKLGRPVVDVSTDAAGCLEELATVQSPAAIDAFRTALSPMHSRTWNVHVDTESLERVRAATAKTGVVFLPAHRSYVDPLVLAEVLHAHDFPRNHVLGGNNMRFWPIGPLGKRAGLVFIRRANADDEVYKFALREYLAYLTSKRFNLEWYVEGGRSRTGKLRPPKLGLLAYLVRALDEGRTEDVALVPVSIAYDQLSEVGAMDAEAAGAAKAAEGTRWLASYIRAQLRDRGHAWVRFGEPFSLREALERAGTGRARLEKVGFEICDGINRATPVTPTALVTFALLGSPGRALTLAEVGRVSAPLLDYFDRRSIPVADTGLSLRTEAGLRDALDRLVAVGVASGFAEGPEPVWTIAQGKDRIAAFYRNGMIHHLVGRGITELALLHVAGDLGSRPDAVGRPLDLDDALEQAWNEARRLRDLLKFEFFFPPTAQFQRDLLAELELIAPDWAAHGEVGELLTSSQLLVAHRTLRSFVDAQFVVAQALVELDPSVEPGEDFVAHCWGLGQQMWLRGRLKQADSVSRELYATALRLAAHRGVVAAGEGAAAARLAFRDEMAGVIGRLDELGRLEENLLSSVLDKWEGSAK
ncbi:MAG: glycerol-3-phosphate 1-O-acyltransferase [Sporichthyaceae bacterium]